MNDEKTHRAVRTSPLVARAGLVEALVTFRGMTTNEIILALNVSREPVREAMRVLRGVHPLHPSPKRIYIAEWRPPPSTSGKGQHIAVWRAGNLPDVKQPRLSTYEAHRRWLNRRKQRRQDVAEYRDGDDNHFENVTG